MVREGERGFTLIEMMIVVAIIAILVGMLVPNFVRARAQAQTAACEANLKEIATALELYESDHDAYPAGSAVPVNASNADLQPYLKQVPVDPVAGPKAYYEYTVTGLGTATAGYTIVCPGLHDPGTLQSISPNTTNGHIQYSADSGFSAVGSQ
ncbi:MAG: type II secretion system protein [Vulcanimicrobiaceae bacterium]